MPCWEVRTVSVEFYAKNRALLEKSLQELGWRVKENSAQAIVAFPKDSYNQITLDLMTGQASFVKGDQGNLNALKRAYSQQAIKLAAKLNGWQVRSLINTKGQLLKGSL